MLFLNQRNGQITSRDLLITISITLVVAAIMIVIVIVFGGRSSQPDADQNTADLINQIKQQAAQEQNNAQETPGAEGVFESQATYTGTISNHVSGASITIRTTANDETILLSSATTIILNGKTAPESDLSIGDTVRVDAERTRSGTQTAITITILRATSPTVPTNVSVPTLQPPPIDTRPISPF